MNKRIFLIKTSCLARFIARLDKHGVKWTSTPIIRAGNGVPRVVRYDVETVFAIPSEAFPESKWVVM